MRHLNPPSHITADAMAQAIRDRAEWIKSQLNEGHSAKSIAEAIGVTKQAVYSTRAKRRATGKPGRPRNSLKPGKPSDIRPDQSETPPTTERPCMTCGKRFASEGPHNRMCSLCRRRGDPFSPR